MSNQNKANANDPLGIIGRKMKGFKFDGFKYNYLNYHLNMNKHIGNEGEIVSYMEEYDCYYCKFSDREWAYPAKLIMQHIVDTPQELTLLEKFEQGWEIMELHNGFRIIDIAKTIKGRYFVKWSDGKIEQYDDLILNAVTCTPPKERKTLYTYCSKTGACYVNEDDKPSDGYQLVYITRIESNGDNWEVVKP